MPFIIADGSCICPPNKAPSLPKLKRPLSLLIYRLGYHWKCNNYSHCINFTATRKTLSEASHFKGASVLVSMPTRHVLKFGTVPCLALHFGTYHKLQMPVENNQ